MLNRSASLLIEQAFSKPSLDNLISKCTHLVFSAHVTVSVTMRTLFFITMQVCTIIYHNIITIVITFIDIQ